MAEAAEGHLTSATRGAWRTRLDAEGDKVRAALTWALEGGSVVLGLRQPQA